MAESSFNKAGEFKSPDRVVVRFLEKSRDLKASNYRKLKKDFDRTCTEMRRLLKKDRELEDELREWKARYHRLDSERYRQAQEATVVLPADPPLGQHGYGARMVVLAIMLARVVGFRAAAKVIKIMFDWLGVKHKVPHFTAIRDWLQRWGVAVIQEPIEKADDWIWMTDHSNQIGQEKILVGLAIRSSKLPPPGTPIRHEDMQVLTVRPGKDWKREDMAKVYTELAQTHGAPRAVISDSAVELQESAECLKELRKDCVILQDFKHKAANYLEASIGKSERFKEFLAQVGTTRCAIQQTEMSHLTPPTLKSKARFMNLSSLLGWSTTMVWLLKTPEAKSRQWMTPERLNAKLGWLLSFEPEMAVWAECQQVINRGLEFINGQKLFDGAAEELHRVMTENLKHDVSRQLADRLTAFVKTSEDQLKENERLSLSTEILESSFALYKQLEGQHSKGGFTSLVATFAGLLKTPTFKTIKEAFAKVSTKDVKAWVAKNLDTTVTSKRRATFLEMRKTTGHAKSDTDCASKTTITI